MEIMTSRQGIQPARNNPTGREGKGHNPHPFPASRDLQLNPEAREQGSLLLPVRKATDRQREEQVWRG